jgi:hypothetical protein
MEKLIGLEIVLIDNPTALQVAANRREPDVERLSLHESIAEAINRGEESYDLNCRYDVTFLGFGRLGLIGLVGAFLSHAVGRDQQ